MGLQKHANAKLGTKSIPIKNNTFIRHATTYSTGELGYDRLNGTRKIGLSYAKSDVYEYLICTGMGPSISSVICKNLSYSGPSYPSSPVILSHQINVQTTTKECAKWY